MTDKQTAPAHDHTPKLAYRIDEAVKASGIGRSFLYEKIANGELPSVKLGKRRLILHADLLKFLTSASRGLPENEDVCSNRMCHPKTKSGAPTKFRLSTQHEFPPRR